MAKVKKVLLMGLSMVLVAAIAIAGTVAYLTDTDSDVNVMTVGKVKIVQNEQQRVEANGEFTNELEAFKQGKKLLPVTYPGNRTDDTIEVGAHEITLGDDKTSYVDKIISVTNTGDEAAYVRTIVAVPTGGAAWEPAPVSANNCWLHWNYPKDTLVYWDLEATDVPMVTINGENYYVWEFIHKAAIEPDETTYPAVSGFYMDQKVDADDEGFFMTYTDGTTKRIEIKDTVKVLAVSQAVQAAGFDKATTALDEAFGDVTEATVATWFSGTVIPTVVNSNDEFKAAVSNKASEIIVDNATLDLSAGIAVNGADITVNGGTVETTNKNYTGIQHSGVVTYNDVTFNGATFLYGEKVVFNNCEFNLTTNYVWTYGAKEVVFNNCTFNTDGKAILIFQDGTTNDQVVTVKDCTFNATKTAQTASGLDVAAVSIDGTNGTYVVNFEGTNTVDEDFAGLYQIKAGEANVTVNE